MARWTKQTYEAIALVLYEHFKEHEGHISGKCGDLAEEAQEGHYMYNLGHVGANSDIQVELAKMFERDNAGFNRAKFYEACNTGKHIRKALKG